VYEEQSLFYSWCQDALISSPLLFFLTYVVLLALCVYSASLDYFTTHVDLVKQQKEAVEKKQKVRKGLASDKDWTGEGLAKETETMVSN
jgi:hypothetical protein